MDKYIKLQDAIDAGLDFVDFYCDNPDAPGAMIEHMESVPVADVRPVVRGKWIDDGSGCVVCSECGEEHEWGMFRANFCDNCGADMREENHG